MLTQQLQAALDSRVVAEQPKGVLAQIHSRTPDEAFDRADQAASAPVGVICSLRCAWDCTGRVVD